MASDSTIGVEVVCVMPREQVVIGLSVPAGTTVRGAIDLSGISSRADYSDEAPLGIYGRFVTRDTILKDGDRVEIYRPLDVDAKQARRRRAARKRA